MSGSGTGTKIPYGGAGTGQSATPGFADQLAADLDIFFNLAEFAKSVIYQPVGGISKVVKAIITYGEGEEYQGADSPNTEATMEIRVSEVAAVSVDASVTIGTEIWSVIDPKKISDGLIWSCIISRINR